MVFIIAFLIVLVVVIFLSNPVIQYYATEAGERDDFYQEKLKDVKQAESLLKESAETRALMWKAPLWVLVVAVAGVMTYQVLSDDGTVIAPFTDAAHGDEKENVALSRAVLFDFSRIYNVHLRHQEYADEEAKFPNGDAAGSPVSVDVTVMRYTDIQAPAPRTAHRAMFPHIHTSTQAGEDLKEIGPLSIGANSFSIQQLYGVLAYLKQAFGHRQVIAGRLYTNNGSVYLQAQLSGRKNYVWEVKRTVGTQPDHECATVDACLPDMSQELSNKIANDMVDEGALAADFRDFKSYTTALHFLNEFRRSGRYADINEAAQICLALNKKSVQQDRFVELCLEVARACLNRPESFAQSPDDCFKHVEHVLRNATPALASRRDEPRWLRQALLMRAYAEFQLKHLDRKHLVEGMALIYEAMDIPKLKHSEQVQAANIMAKFGLFNDAAEIYKGEYKYEPNDNSKPDPATYQIWLGNVALAANDPDSASRHYGKAALYNASNAWADFGLGNVCLTQRRYEQAVQYYETAAQKTPKIPDLYNNWGYALVRLGKENEAADLFWKAVAMTPRKASLKLNLGLLKWRRFQSLCVDPAADRELTRLKGPILKWSILRLEDAVNLDPANAEAHFYLALSYLADENLQGAKTELEKVRELDPQSDAQYFSFYNGVIEAKLGEEEEMDGSPVPAAQHYAAARQAWKRSFDILSSSGRLDGGMDTLTVRTAAGMETDLMKLKKEFGTLQKPLSVDTRDELEDIAYDLTLLQQLPATLKPRNTDEVLRLVLDALKHAKTSPQK